MKSLIKIAIVLLIAFPVSLFPDYLALKSGKIYKTDGKIRIDGDNALFQMKGSDFEITIPLSKVDMVKTKKMNQPRKKKTEKKKTIKVFTNKDVKKGSSYASGYYDDEGEEGENDESGDGTNPEIFEIPDYSWDEIAGNDQDWWTAEVERVQKNFADAVKYNRKRISEYNSMILEYNKANVKEREAMKDRVTGTAELMKDSNEMIKAWYGAMQQLKATGEREEVQSWIIKALTTSIDSNKTLVE